MKKIIKQLDGTEVVFEGTPAELAELENSLGRPKDTNESQKGKKKLLLETMLTEEQCRQLVEELKLVEETMRQNRSWPYVSPYPLWPYVSPYPPVLPQPWWGIYPPTVQDWCTITTTSNIVDASPTAGGGGVVTGVGPGGPGANGKYVT